MIKQLNVWSYNEKSNSAKLLAQALGIKRLKHEGSTYKAHPNKIIINWGDSKMPANLRASSIINSPNVVGSYSNKLKFFEFMDETEVRLVPWTTDIAVASQWSHEGKTTVVRNVLTGHSGDGIVIIEPNQNKMPVAPLYTQYVPKKDEFRVHFFNRKIIDVQQKKRRLEVDEDHVDYKVRSHANGFNFCRNDLVVPADVQIQAQLCINDCGLDFGAIDIIYNQKQKMAYVLEINCAPGLEGATVESYAKAIKEFLL